MLELSLKMLEMNPTIDEEAALWTIVDRELELLKLK